MRVLGIKQDDNWTNLNFDTTYAMGWHTCQTYAICLLEFMNNIEILTAEIAGTRYHMTDAKNPKDIFNLPEKGVLIIRGNNKIYDNAPFQFVFFNQTHQINVDILKEYTDTLKKSETEYMTKDDLLHTFDRFMDSLELRCFMNMETFDIFNMISDAFKKFTKETDTKNANLILKRNGNELNLTEITNSIKNTSIIDLLCDNVALYKENHIVQKLIEKYGKEEVYIWCGYNENKKKWSKRDCRIIDERKTVKIYATYELAMADSENVKLKEPKCIKKIPLDRVSAIKKNGAIIDYNPWNIILVSDRKELLIAYPDLYEKSSIYNPFSKEELPDDLILSDKDVDKNKS